MGLAVVGCRMSQRPRCPGLGPGPQHCWEELDTGRQGLWEEASSSGTCPWRVSVLLPHTVATR